MKRTLQLALGASLGALMLSGCGARAPLEPATGNSAPPAPFGATDSAEPEQLLELEALAAPERSVELRRRSEEREDDPFDLPPE